MWLRILSREHFLNFKGMVTDHTRINDIHLSDNYNYDYTEHKNLETPI